MHFLQESYNLLQESQILQICYNFEHLLQILDNILIKFACIRKKILQKAMCYFDQKFIKLPAKTATFTVHKAQTAKGSWQKGQNG